VAAAPLIRTAIHSVDPFIGLDQIGTLEHFEYESMAPPRVTATLLGIFAGLALLISVGGIAAAMTLNVTERSRELGIRMALGARRSSIFGMVGAILLTRLFATLLYAASPTDLTTFLAVSILFVSVGVAACLVPARQVTSIL
jgi:ABC-type antimicrobial peptide transport system permease subunit